MDIIYVYIYTVYRYQERYGQVKIDIDRFRQIYLDRQIQIDIDRYRQTQIYIGKNQGHIDRHRQIQETMRDIQIDIDRQRQIQIDIDGYRHRIKDIQIDIDKQRQTQREKDLDIGRQIWSAGTQTSYDILGIVLIRGCCLFAVREKSSWLAVCQYLLQAG